MSQLISKWLNTCGLSIKVLPSTVEGQFANGYRIGELLMCAYHAKRLKLMDESDFSRFVDNNTRSASINNFLLLQPILRSMQIALPVDQVRRIVIQERGAVLDLLFKIRLALSRHDGKFPVVKVRKFEASIFNIHRDEKPPQPMWTRATDIYDTIVDPRKTAAERDMGIHLHHFEESQNAWEEKCALMDVDEILRTKAAWKERKDIEIQHMKEKAEFSTKWEQDQITRWAETQKRQISKERNDLMYELSAVEKSRRKKVVKTRRAERDLDESVNWFERNRKRLGVGGGDDDDDDDAASGGAGGDGEGQQPGVDRVTPLEHLARMEERTAPLLKTLTVPARNYMKQLHERAEEEKQNRKDRGARKRKQLLDQRNAQQDAEKGKHKAALLKSVISMSKSERDAAEVKWRSRHLAQLAEKENVVARAAKDQKRVDMLNAYFRDLTTTAREAAEERLEEENTIRTTLRLNLQKRQEAKHAERIKWIGEGLVKNLVELAILVVTSKETEAGLGRDALISRRDWRTMRGGFVQGYDPRQYKHWRDSLNGTKQAGSNTNQGDTLNDESEDVAKMEPYIHAQLDQAERLDFNARKGAWAPLGSDAVDEKAKHNSDDYASIEETSACMEQIGQMLRVLCEPLPAPPPAQLSADCPLVGMSILGAPSFLVKLAASLGQGIEKRRSIRVVSEIETQAMARSLVEGTLGDEKLQFLGEDCKNALLALGDDIQNAEGEDPPRSPDPSLLAKALVTQVKQIVSQPQGTSGGWLLLGWPATKEQATMLEFELEGDMTGGVPYEKASGPKSKWKPPPAEGAKSVINCILEIVPATEVEDDNGAGEAGEDSTHDGKKDETADVEVEEAMLKADEEWQEVRSFLLDTWYVDRCRIKSFPVSSTIGHVELGPYPSLELLLLDDIYLETRDSLKAAARAKGEEEEVPDSKDQTETQEETLETCEGINMDLGISNKPLLTAEDCSAIQQDQIEAAIRRGQDPEACGALSIVNSNVVRSLLDRWSASEATFDKAILPIFRKMRLSIENLLNKWSAARSSGLSRLGASGTSEEIISSFNHRMKEIASQRPIPLEIQKKLRSQLNEEIDEIIDSLYSATSEKQREAEHLHASLVHSDWNSNHLAVFDTSLKKLVDAYVRRVESVSDVIFQYFSEVEEKFRKCATARSTSNAMQKSESSESKSATVENEALDTSPSALPEFGTESEQSAVPIIAIEEKLASNPDAIQSNSLRSRSDDALDNIRSTLPEFVASCMTTLQRLDENTANQTVSKGEYPDLCTKIIRQLWKSVDDFILTVVEQAESRITLCEDKAQSTTSELDEWIGNVVAAETASVGTMRKSMLTALSAVFDSEVEETSPSLKVAMRYGVDVKDDGPSKFIFDTRCKDSTLRSPRNLRLSSTHLRILIQSLRASAVEPNRSRDKRKGRYTQYMSLASFVDTIYRLACAGQLPVTWSSLPRSTLTELGNLYDYESTGMVSWCDFCVGQIFAQLPMKGGLPNVSAIKKMYSSFVRADNLSPTQSSADIVEWNEYCSVNLWFEADNLISEDFAWQIRELIWLIYSENASAESRGELSYPDFVMTLAQDPRSGSGAMRAMGLFKAWHLQCILSQCQNGMLHRDAFVSLLSCASCKPRLAKDVVDSIASELFGDIEGDKTVSFQDAALVLDSRADDGISKLFVMPNAFDVLRV